MQEERKSAWVNILINSHAILIKNIMCQENEQCLRAIKELGFLLNLLLLSHGTCMLLLSREFFLLQLHNQREPLLTKWVEENKKTVEKDSVCGLLLSFLTKRSWSSWADSLPSSGHTLSWKAESWIKSTSPNSFWPKFIIFLWLGL